MREAGVCLNCVDHTGCSQDRGKLISILLIGAWLFQCSPAVASEDIYGQLPIVSNDGETLCLSLTEMNKELKRLGVQS